MYFIVVTPLGYRKFGTVNPAQLWKFYNEVAEGLPTDMESIMKTWTDEPGYPLVTVRVNQSDGVITLKQVLSIACL